MRWFIADPHFGHEKLVRTFPRLDPRTCKPFPSIDDHDAYLLDCINKAVHRDDELHILGDLAWDKPGKYRQQINCRHVYLTRGNHDKPGKCRNVFGEIPYVRHTKVRFGGDSLNVVLCHTPFAFWEGSHNGWGHLYGHCHGMREETMDRWMPDRRSFDCSVDNIVRTFGDSFRPLNEETVYSMFYLKKGHDLPSFYPNNRATREIASE